MARPVTTLVIFFLAFNLFSAMLIGTGTAAMIGLDAEVGGDQAVDSATAKTDQVATGTGLGGTLFGMYNVLASGIKDVFLTIFPGLTMLERAGTPGYITTMLGPLFSFVIFIDVVSFLRGWGL